MFNREYLFPFVEGLNGDESVPNFDLEEHVMQARLEDDYYDDDEDDWDDEDEDEFYDDDDDDSEEYDW